MDEKPLVSSDSDIDSDSPDSNIDSDNSDILILIL